MGVAVNLAVLLAMIVWMLVWGSVAAGALANAHPDARGMQTTAAAVGDSSLGTSVLCER